MDKSTVNKIMTLCFLIGGALVFWVMGVLLDTAAGSFAFVAQMRANPLILHGLPLLFGVATFLWLQLSEKNRKFTEEVIIETSKVVWPTGRDVKGMTVAVSIMLIISGLVLAGFDILAGKSLTLLLGL